MDDTHNNLPPGGVGVLCAASIQIFRCSIHIPGGKLERFVRIRLTAHSILLARYPVCHINHLYQFKYGFPWGFYLPLELCPVLCDRL